MPILLKTCDLCGGIGVEMTKNQSNKKSGERRCILCQHKEFWEKENPRILSFIEKGVRDILEWNNEDYSENYGRFLEQVVNTCDRVAHETMRSHGPPNEILGSKGKGKGRGLWNLEINRTLFGFGRGKSHAESSQSKGEKSFLGEKGDKSSFGKGFNDKSSLGVYSKGDFSKGSSLEWSKSFSKGDKSAHSRDSLQSSRDRSPRR